MLDEEIWTLERKLWLDGPDVYDRSMDQACVMAFPGMGVMKATEVIESLKQAPRWASVQFEQQMIGRAGDDVIVLAYHAKGEREGNKHYTCWCTSTYRRHENDWVLVQHQQTLDK